MISIVLIIALSPFLLLIAVLVGIDSEGPVIFKQIRVGKDLRNFTIYKFRTMKIDSQPFIRGDGTYITSDEDPRVTRMGKLLRNGLDELPQLINIFLGQMSLVGPRPDLPIHVEDYTAHQLKKYTVRPGLANLPAISGRNSLELNERIEIDLKYIREMNFSTDIKIIWFTTMLVLFGYKR